MSAASGIGVTSELSEAFSAAIDSNDVRALKVSIRNESLVHDVSINISGSLEEDLPKLQELLEPNVPAYLLVRLDNPGSGWLAVYYVPDAAKVRDKMLYASTRTALLKSLGSTVFVDSIFATSKDDLTPHAYAHHKKHMASPKPLSPREQEMADLKAAEWEAGSRGYDGSRSRQNHLGTGVGLNWSQEVEDAVRSLGAGEQSQLVVISIDTSSEILSLTFVADTSIQELGSTIPSTAPSYSFFAWPHAYTSPPRREIVFIYSCPSQSPIKHRMVYSSGASSVFQSAQKILEGSTSVLVARKVETSDPTELDEAYLKAELGFGTDNMSNSKDVGSSISEGSERKPFAKPKGPGRRR